MERLTDFFPCALTDCYIQLHSVWILPPIEHRFLLRWLPRVFSNNPSYLAYDTEGNVVTLSLRFGSRNSPLSLPM